MAQSKGFNIAYLEANPGSQERQIVARALSLKRSYEASGQTISNEQAFSGAGQLASNEQAVIAENKEKRLSDPGLPKTGFTYSKNFFTTDDPFSREITFTAPAEESIYSKNLRAQYNPYQGVQSSKRSVDYVTIQKGSDQGTLASNMQSFMSVAQGKARFSGATIGSAGAWSVDYTTPSGEPYQSYDSNQTRNYYNYQPTDSLGQGISQAPEITRGRTQGIIEGTFTHPSGSLAMQALPPSWGYVTASRDYEGRVGAFQTNLDFFGGQVAGYEQAGSRYESRRQAYEANPTEAGYSAINTEYLGLMEQERGLNESRSSLRSQGNALFMEGAGLNARGNALTETHLGKVQASLGAHWEGVRKEERAWELSHPIQEALGIPSGIARERGFMDEVVSTPIEFIEAPFVGIGALGGEAIRYGTKAVIGEADYGEIEQSRSVFGSQVAQVGVLAGMSFLGVVAPRVAPGLIGSASASIGRVTTKLPLPALTVPAGLFAGLQAGVNAEGVLSGDLSVERYAGKVAGGALTGGLIGVLSSTKYGEIPGVKGEGAQYKGVYFETKDKAYHLIGKQEGKGFVFGKPTDLVRDGVEIEILTKANMAILNPEETQAVGKLKKLGDWTLYRKGGVKVKGIDFDLERLTPSENEALRGLLGQQQKEGSGLLSRITGRETQFYGSGTIKPQLSIKSLGEFGGTNLVIHDVDALIADPAKASKRAVEVLGRSGGEFRVAPGTFKVEKFMEGTWKGVIDYHPLGSTTLAGYQPTRMALGFQGQTPTRLQSGQLIMRFDESVLRKGVLTSASFSEGGVGAIGKRTKDLVWRAPMFEELFAGASASDQVTGRALLSAVETSFPAPAVSAGMQAVPFSFASGTSSSVSPAVSVGFGAIAGNFLAPSRSPSRASASLLNLTPISKLPSVSRSPALSRSSVSSYFRASPSPLPSKSPLGSLSPSLSPSNSFSPSPSRSRSPSRSPSLSGLPSLSPISGFSKSPSSSPSGYSPFSWSPSPSPSPSRSPGGYDPLPPIPPFGGDLSAGRFHYRAPELFSSRRGKTGYRPDLTSVVFGFKSKKAPKGFLGGDYFSGLELRPLI